MRLIDADKIVEVAEHAYGEWNKAMGAADGWQIDRCYKMQELCKAVKGVADGCPTIDPESLRPAAHWIKRGYVCGENEYVCSACQETEWRTSANRMKYCMFCGARMVNADE